MYHPPFSHTRQTITHLDTRMSKISHGLYLEQKWHRARMIDTACAVVLKGIFFFDDNWDCVVGEMTGLFDVQKSKAKLIYRKHNWKFCSRDIVRYNKKLHAYSKNDVQNCLHLVDRISVIDDSTKENKNYTIHF